MCHCGNSCNFLANVVVADDDVAAKFALLGVARSKFGVATVTTSWEALGGSTVSKGDIILKLLGREEGVVVCRGHCCEPSSGVFAAKHRSLEGFW